MVRLYIGLRVMQENWSLLYNFIQQNNVFKLFTVQRTVGNLFFTTTEREII